MKIVFWFSVVSFLDLSETSHSDPTRTTVAAWRASVSAQDVYRSTNFTSFCADISVISFEMYVPTKVHRTLVSLILGCHPKAAHPLPSNCT